MFGEYADVARAAVFNYFARKDVVFDWFARRRARLAELIVRPSRRRPIRPAGFAPHSGLARLYEDDPATACAVRVQRSFLPKASTITLSP